MPTQYKRSWVLLRSFAACAGLAATPVFAAQPHALMRLVQVGDASDSHVTVGFIDKNAEVQSQVDLPPENPQIMYLIKLLKGSSQFRVRAQAAIALGVMEKSLAARGALTAALQDVHPAVRAAAATALGRIGDANHVVALRTLSGDPEEPVRNAARASIGRIESAIE